MKQSLIDRLWCLWNSVCYKHGVEKAAGINVLYCPLCTKEAHERYRQRLARIAATKEAA